MFQNLLLLIKFVIRFFKKKLINLQILLIVNSILQIVTIFSFAPLILFLSDASKISEYNLFFFNNFDQKNIFFYIIFTIIVLFIISNLFNVAVSNLSLKLGQKIGINLNYKIYSYIINKDYSYHVKTNSAEIISKITLETARVVNSILIPLLLINSRILVVITILIGMLVINFVVSLTVFVFLIISYLLIFLLQKKRLGQNSNLISQNNKLRQRTIAESIGNMRETILFRSQNLFLKIFNLTNNKIGMSIASNQFLSSIPRNVIEIFVFTILIVLVFILKKQNTLENYLPLIGIYLVAAYKLLPSIQNIATSYASIKGNYSALENISTELKYFYSVDYRDEIETFDYKTDNFLFQNIEIKNFDFSYKEKKIFDKANIKISQGDVIGITGETGIGKSSLIDLICGLIVPDNGSYKLNNENINKKNKSYLINNISLVPQRINLIDDTIKNNIIFPHIDKNFDDIENKLENLRDVCELNYIEDLASGWESIVGENGSKLSGGQIQRIGIARALFKKPQLLILDEATSALDEKTQSKILENIFNIKENLTIIIISHNQSVIDKCKKVYEIKDFKINIK